jgi:cystathionine beta-lyase
VAGQQRATGDHESYVDLRPRRSSYKWSAFPKEILPAFVAETDFDLAPAVEHALEAAIRNGDTGYASRSSDIGTVFSSFARRRYGWQVAPENVTLVPDVMAGVLEVLRRVIRRGAGVVINTPVYRPFFTHIAEAGCRVVEAPLAYHGGAYALDLDALERAFDGASVYLLCNPHNPTGLAFSRAQLQQIVALAERHNVTILSDEIHAPLVLRHADHVPILSIGDEASVRTISFHSASKAWNIPGLKCAQAVCGSDAMRAVLESLPEAVGSRTGHLGVIASLAAYADESAWLDDLIDTLEANHNLFAELLTQAGTGLRHVRPAATYLAWLDCRDLELGDDPAVLFRERGRVAFDSGLRFGTSGAGFCRATLATTEATIREMVRRVVVALEGNDPT